MILIDCAVCPINGCVANKWHGTAHVWWNNLYRVKSGVGKNSITANVD